MNESVKPDYWDRATRALARRDAVLRRLIRTHAGIHLQRRSDPFTTLARAIVGQQISVKAADSVWRRFLAVNGVDVPEGAFPRLDAARVARLTVVRLRGCGLSANKAEYVRDLARHFATGVLDPESWSALDDEGLIESLTTVKGIGRWTAEMFLIFHQLRPDVLPVADLGLQRAVALHYNDGERISVAELREIAQRWAPWRSVATWYLWRSLDPVPVEY